MNHYIILRNNHSCTHYYNSYDSYSYYYGPRGKSSALNTTRNQQNISQLYANGTIRGDHSNTPVINQASNNEQPFIKIKQNSSLTNATNTGTIKGGDVKDPKSIKNGNTNDFNTPIKVNPNVISNDDHIIKTGHDVKVNDDNNSNAPIKIPTDIKGGNQVISNDNAPANNPTNIKVNHNVPDRNIRVNQQNDNSSVPVKTIRNENIQPSDGIIKNPKNQAPVRSNGNDYNPDNNLNNSNPNNNIRNIRNEPPVKQNDNNYNSAPVKNPRSSNGEINDQMPVKNERRKSDFLQHIKKVETSEPTRESNHSPSRNDRNNNQSAPQQPTAQPNQQQQRNNDGDNGGRIQTRPRR